MFVYLNGAPPAPCIGVHGHHCPCCYEIGLCLESCTREEDCEDSGQQMGAYAMCDACRSDAARKGE